MNKGHDKGHKGQMSDREVIKLALKALESSQESGSVGVKIDNAIAALRQALEQEPWDTSDMAHRAGGLSMEQKPVAFIRIKKDKLETDWVDGATVWDGAKLYTAPPKREWVGLTGDEVNDLKHWLDHRAQWSYIEFARAIEAKLKEKNT